MSLEIQYYLSNIHNITITFFRVDWQNGPLLRPLPGQEAKPNLRAFLSKKQAVTLSQPVFLLTNKYKSVRIIW